MRTAKQRGDSRRTFLVQAGSAAGAVALAPALVGASAAADEHDRPKTPATGHNGAAAATESQAPPFDFHNVTMPQRKSFDDYNADDVTRLETAYGRLKAFRPDDPKNLAADDPRAWRNQAKIHAAHCRGSLMEVHFGWWFAAWHRGFLFFYERILASLSDDPTSFALPYWDWAGHQEVPNTRYRRAENQASPFFDTQSPLYDALRFPQPGTTFQQRNFSNAAYYCSADYLNNQLLTETDFTNFCGGDPSTGGGAGDLEAFPHNNVHIWTGLNDDAHQGQDMDDLSTAAKDLLFFLHHANIDRLFTLWLAQNHPLPPPSSPWHRQWFNFYDADGKLYSVTVDDALNHMGGNYQAPQQAFPLITEPQEIALGGPAKTFANVGLPAALQTKLATAPPVPAMAPAPARHRVRLRLEGVEAPHDVPVVLHVFLNNPNATLADVNGPGFAGTLTMLPASGVGSRRHRPVDLSLELPPPLAAQLKDRQAVSVTVVPEQLGFRRAEAASKLSFKKIAVITRN